MFREVFEGLNVVELASYLPLPYVGGVLAEMGAKVFKIEPPFGGDPLKGLDNGAYHYLNQKKEILYLNLKDEGDRKKVERLILEADVVLNGFRKNFLKSVGLDFDRLFQKNGRVIYINLAGYEKGLKDEDRAGHDLNFVAISGIMQSLPEMNRPLPFQLADMAGALWAIIGVFYMLERRRRSGRGGELDISLFRSLLAFFPFFYGGGREGAVEKGMFSGSYACYNLYETKDGKRFAFGCIEKKFFIRALDLLQIPYDEERLYDFAYQGELIEAIKERVKKKSYAELERLFEKEDICITPVLDKQAFYRYLEEQGVMLGRLRDFLFMPIGNKEPL